MEKVYLYAIGGNLSFALGSIVFAHFSRKISPEWMNFMKASIAFICFALVISLTSGWHILESNQIGLFAISGFIGLGAGDIFLLKGFSELGPSRSLMLFGFQPILLGVLSYLFLDQNISSKQLVAIIFLILCLLTFSLERYKSKGHWDNKGLIFILIGVSLDAIAILITRRAFEMDHFATSLEGNFYRCLGAIILLLVINKLKPFGIIKNFKLQKMKPRLAIIVGSVLGTFLSLGLYLKAVQTGHLASISAVSITGSIFSALFESVYERKWPSRYLLLAFAFFLIGARLLIF